MKVAVTGGTGYVGGHTVAALVAAGHAVRLLVRSPEKVAATLDPLGVDAAALEVVTADITDEQAVRRGMEGADAVIHAASVFTFDPARKAEMDRANDLGMRHVIGGAIDLGLDPIVHVSSIVALLRTNRVDDVLTGESPVGDPPVAYPASKARQETWVRGLQEEGHPVVITYPGGVYGPNDPYDGESLQLVRAAYQRLFTFVPDGGLPVVDVRDLAAVQTAAMEPGQGPRRFMAGGSYATLEDLVSEIGRASGRSLPTMRVPLAMAKAAGRVGDALAARGRHIGVSSEGVWVSSRRARPDNSQTTAALGVAFRPLESTISDMVRWALAEGRIG